MMDNNESALVNNAPELFQRNLPVYRTLEKRQPINMIKLFDLISGEDRITREDFSSILNLLIEYRDGQSMHGDVLKRFDNLLNILKSASFSSNYPQEIRKEAYKTFPPVSYGANAVPLYLMSLGVMENNRDATIEDVQRDYSMQLSLISQKRNNLGVSNFTHEVLQNEIILGRFNPLPTIKHPAPKK